MSPVPMKTMRMAGRLPCRLAQVNLNQETWREYRCGEPVFCVMPRRCAVVCFPTARFVRKEVLSDWVEYGICFSMEHGRLPRILIITAGYGEGHNSAARGVQEAVKGRAETRLVDLCAEAMPAMFRMTRAGYLWVISRMPGLWKLMYDVSDRRNMAEKPVKGLGPVEGLLERLLLEWKPDAVVCTYMVYPYMLDSIAARTGRAVPYITVVTDSFVINKSWL